MKRILLGLVMLTVLVVSVVISVPAQGRPPNFCLRHPNSPKCVSPTPTTPAPTTTTAAPGGDCTGVSVSPGGGLKAAMDSFSTPHTFCLGAGTYTVSQTIVVEGDTVVGAGRNATFIDGSGLDRDHSRIFYDRGSQGVATFRNFDISGARAPLQAGTCFNQVGQQSNSACGKAFVLFGPGTIMRHIDCHDNGDNCASGNSDLVMDDVNCYANGSAYATTSGFAHSGCLKQAAAYSAGDNDVVVMNSHIHNNIGTGLWCDFCKYGFWDIHDNVISNNTHFAVQWEMSGGWSSSDSAHIYRNTIQNNSCVGTFNVSAGLVNSNGNDALIEDNTFGSNCGDGFRVVFTVSRVQSPQPGDSRGTVFRNNTMNGDTIRGCDLAGVTCSGNS